MTAPLLATVQGQKLPVGCLPLSSRPSWRRVSRLFRRSLVSPATGLAEFSTGSHATGRLMEDVARSMDGAAGPMITVGRAVKKAMATAVLAASPKA